MYDSQHKYITCTVSESYPYDLFKESGHMLKGGTRALVHYDMVGELYRLRHG